MSILDLNNLSITDLKLLDKLHSQLIKEYHDFIEELYHDTGAGIDWLVNTLLSRNNHLSNVFLYFCECPKTIKMMTVYIWRRFCLSKCKNKQKR